MRKVVNQLDEQQRQTLLEWADLGAIFSSALIVATLMWLVDLMFG
jgi:hypothetical protein